MFAFTGVDLIKIAAALVIGSIIGLEREVHNKAAGLRTVILICVGATLFSIISGKLGDDRVAAGIVTGIGFLGAGVILYDQGRLKGLTTAASIWASAAIGLTIGQGEFILAVFVTIVVMVVLVFLANVDRLLDRFGRETRTYDVVYIPSETKLKQLEDLMRDYGMTIRSHRPMKQEGKLVSIWEVEAHAKDHDRFCHTLMEDKDITELTY